MTNFLISILYLIFIPNTYPIRYLGNKIYTQTLYWKELQKGFSKQTLAWIGGYY